MTDINECERGISGCEGNCTDTIGGFNCSCSEGFVLGADGKSCIGKYNVHK